MKPADRRSEDRLKVLLHATVFLQSEPQGIRCGIRDASAQGCMLVSSCANEFPDTIEFLVDGIEQRLFGQVVWRQGKTAGVRFDWPAGVEESDEFVDWLELGSDEAVDQPCASDGQPDGDLEATEVAGAESDVAAVAAHDIAGDR
ncbi:MAG: PilZ domain-containing protein [Methyloligellaceae bacterium]